MSNSTTTQTGSTLQVATHGDRAIKISRQFNAPRELVFDAFTKPDMLKEWFHGPPGWKLTTCEVDLRVGGTYRREWTSEAGESMGMGGVFQVVERPGRVVRMERYDQPWYQGECVGTFELTVAGKGTLMTLTMAYESREVRDQVMTSPVMAGMDTGYAGLEKYLERVQQGTHPIITPPEVITTKEVITATIPLVIPCQDMGAYMDPAIQEVIKVISGQGAQIAGPMFSFHKRRPSDSFDFEIGFPVSGAIKEEGRVINSKLPAVKVVRSVYQGPYDGLGTAWGEVQKWVRGQQLPESGKFWESYLNNPDEVENPKDYRTELNWIVGD